jgi:hypothetical protein
LVLDPSREEGFVLCSNHSTADELPLELGNKVLGTRPLLPRREFPRSCIQIKQEGGFVMPEKEVVDRAKEDLKEGKSPSTAAGEFVHEEIEHVREGKHGARSPQQAIAIGLSKARRAGIPLAPPSPGKTKKSTRVSAERDYRKGQAGTTKKVSAKRSRATEAALKKEPRSTVSHKALSAHAKKAAKAR